VRDSGYIEECFRKAFDFRLSMGIRSAVWHELIEEAQERGDDDFWDRVTKEIVRSCNDHDDISGSISDHLVETCPDNVFIRYGIDGPYHHYRAWRKRGQRLVPNAPKPNYRK